MAVSLDFVAATLQSLLAEFREIKTTADLDRRNARMSYDNLAAEVARAIGGIDAKLEMAVAHIDERFTQVDEQFVQIDERFTQIDDRLDGIDAKLETTVTHIDERLDRIEALLKGGA